MHASAPNKHYISWHSRKSDNKYTPAAALRNALRAKTRLFVPFMITAYKGSSGSDG